MRIEQLHRWHFEKLLAQGCDVAAVLENPEFLPALTPNGFAGMVDRGVVACMGACEQNPGNWRCWAHTDSVLARRYFLALNKAMKAWLSEFRPRRIETIVLRGNQAGHRWALLHDFTMEGIMEEFIPGHDGVLYARINR